MEITWLELNRKKIITKQMLNIKSNDQNKVNNEQGTSHCDSTNMILIVQGAVLKKTMKFLTITNSALSIILESKQNNRLASRFPWGYLKVNQCYHILLNLLEFVKFHLKKNNFAFLISNYKALALFS